MDLEKINKALMNSIDRLEKLNIKDEHARDEIMRSNAIQMAARTIVQAHIASAAINKVKKSSVKGLTYDKDLLAQ